MNNCPCENYAKQADEIQPKAKAPRPKKEVAKKPDPKKIFEGAKDSRTEAAEAAEEEALSNPSNLTNLAKVVG